MPTMVEITRRARERRAEALSMRRQGRLLREIGAHFGVGIDQARSLVLAGERQEQRASQRRGV